MSRSLNAAITRSTTSTFSCDIARPVSRDPRVTGTATAGHPRPTRRSGTERAGATGGEEAPRAQEQGRTPVVLLRDRPPQRVAKLLGVGVKVGNVGLGRGDLLLE